jgi:GntR family transcriptional regulator, transcriptional repressor for pyruvate dehydrogenase complex
MFNTIKKARLSDEIVKQIKETLFAGKLQVGDRLPTERELAEQFETSRASVREAMRALEQEGMIHVRKGVSGGIFIADLDHRPVTNSFQTLLHLRKISIINIAEVRLIFEPEAARLAAERASEEDLRELEEVIQQMSVAVKGRELPDSFDLKFHQIIARAAGNPILEMLAESMLGLASKTITELHPSVETLRHVLASHRKIFEAIRKHDSKLACRTMREHIVDVQTRLAKQADRQERAAKTRQKNGDRGGIRSV